MISIRGVIIKHMISIRGVVIKTYDFNQRSYY